MSEEQNSSTLAKLCGELKIHLRVFGIATVFGLGAYAILQGVWYLNKYLGGPL